MSHGRLLGTSAAMGGIALALSWLTPAFPQMADAVLAAQHTADTSGAEALLVAVTGLLAWGIWSWGALGLLLTAGSALPGAVGRAAGGLVRVVLPEAARRGAALALGLGLSVAAPTSATAVLVVVAPPAAAAPATAPELPDWPPAGQAGPAAEPPDWPQAPPLPPTGGHVVVPGDCLWDIAAARLTGQPDGGAAPADIARATHRWWAANSDVIGPDPDLLLPGQVLRPPPA